ncbi:MAG: helix-turn-helix transcriptional regulator, partial [Lentisphaeria bacterium]|nr:helix-turn-helix transcriptional regulator [Lentisphaeria bacterium]
TAFITCPDVRFSYGSPAGTRRNHCYCCFQGKRAEEYMESGFLPIDPENPLIPVYDYRFFLERFRLLINQLRFPDQFHHARGVLLLEELLLTLQGGNAISAQQEKNHWMGLHALQEEIAASPEKTWDFEAEAKRLSLSYSQFRFLYKQMTGNPPWRYLLECRLRKAEELLLSSSLRINEIAHLCGFEDEFHFSRSFRRSRGLSPTLFRTNYNE